MRKLKQYFIKNLSSEMKFEIDPEKSGYIPLKVKDMNIEAIEGVDNESALIV